MIELFKKLIIENQERIPGVELIERDMSIDPSANYVIVGPRRAGKTYFLYQLIQKKFDDNSVNRVLYINFEDERLLEMGVGDFHYILDAYHELFRVQPFIYFDEIQNMEGWEIFCRRLADEGHRIFVTGSNATMLSKDIATTLGGRYMIKEISPLSFREYLTFNGMDMDSHIEYSSKVPSIRSHFSDYLKYGGFPELRDYTYKRDYLTNLYKKVFYGDILARYNLKNKKALELLVKKIAESVNDETSFNRIKNLLKSTGIRVGTQTIIDYLDYLEESYLVFSISNYVNKFTDREIKKKYYFVDTGILNLFMLDGFGKLFENLVFNELTKRYGSGIFYNKRRFETDFYLPNYQLLIQVSYDISDVETKQREINALQSAMKELTLKNGWLLTNSPDEEDIEAKGKIIRVRPAWKWLLKLYE